MMTSRLSANSINVTITLAHLIQNMDQLLLEDISKDEKKNLKFIMTYAKKYFDSIGGRVDASASVRLKSKLMNYVPTLIPKSDNKHVVLDYDDFADLSEVIIEERCKDCNGIDNCPIEKAFHDAFIPELIIPGKENRPCLYSYTDADLYDAIDAKKQEDPNIMKKAKEHKERAKSKRSRAKRRR